MGLISRVSSRTYRFQPNKPVIFLNFIQPWEDAQQDVTVIVRTNLTRNLDSTVVYQILKSEFTILVTKEQALWPFLSISLWSQMNTNKFHPKLWKLPEFPLTNIWPRFVVKMVPSQNQNSPLSRNKNQQNVVVCRC